MRAFLAFAALCASLATGVWLGSGPLADDVAEIRSQVEPKHHEEPVAPGSDPLDQALIDSLAPTTVAGVLQGQTVAVVTLPGASSATVEALASLVTAAGGVVAGTTALTNTLTDTGNTHLVDSLGAQVAEQIQGLVEPSLTAYPRLGAILGRALAPAPDPAAQTTVNTVRDVLATGELTQAPITGPGAGLFVLVTGNEVDSTMISGVVTGIASTGIRGVVVGTTNDGTVAAVRSTAAPVGTFDGVETAAGRLDTVLLAAHQLVSAGGSYGASGSDGAVVLR